MVAVSRICGSPLLTYCSPLTFVGAHTDKDLLPRSWLGLGRRPNRRRKRWLIAELLLLVAVVAITQWAMLTVATDETQSTLIRVMAFAELFAAAVWTEYVIRVLLPTRPWASSIGSDLH